MALLGSDEPESISQIDNWSQWLLLAAIIATVIGLIIALNPSRRE